MKEIRWHKCGVHGHKSAECCNVSKVSWPIHSPTCYFCHKVGHLSKDCRSKQVASAGLHMWVNLSNGISSDNEKSQKVAVGYKWARKVANTPIVNVSIMPGWSWYAVIYYLLDVLVVPISKVMVKY